MNDRPLITFAVSAYNQVRFIRDAIEGAFSQTYSPLEIILSDDRSTDGSFAVMHEMASNYSGPHRIILNRNDRNLGFCGHINRLMELTSGELVITAQGDDISMPERAEFIREAWEYSGRSVTSIYSDYFVIDETGVQWDWEKRGKKKDGPLFVVQRGDLREFMAVMRPMVHGCTHAWSRCLFNHFGQLPERVRLEDFLLSFRSLAINGILYIDRPLIKYRRHDQNNSSHAADGYLDWKSAAGYDAKRRATLDQLTTAYDAAVHDVETLRQMGAYDIQYLAGVEQEARRVQELYALELQMMSENFAVRAGALYNVLLNNGIRKALKLAPQLFPRQQYHKLRDIKRKVRGRHKRGDDYKRQS